MGEQELNALGVFKCSDIIEKRGLISALFSDTAAECLMEVGLGLGRSRHHQALKEGEVGRKGRSVERTFAPIHQPHDLEAKVRCCHLSDAPKGPKQRDSGLCCRSFLTTVIDPRGTHNATWSLLSAFLCPDGARNVAGVSSRMLRVNSGLCSAAIWQPSWQRSWRPRASVARRSPSS